MNKVAHTIIKPARNLNLLSQEEIYKLSNPRAEIFQLVRDCILAILNTDSQEDDAEAVMQHYADFDIRLLPQSRGVTIEVFNAPAKSFVDGKIIHGIQEHISSVLRDIVYTDFTILQQTPEQPQHLTDMVFRILRNANVLHMGEQPNLVVCWGGHSIPRDEYDYAKEVGYCMGLRGLDIITGCGIGAMKGPMKGAAVGHAKQQMQRGRYIGITEPGIIASESPNAIVNELVIMPDIEKRLEAFVRVGHAIIVFPGGAGTVEEILYILSILLHPDNQVGIPLIFTGPDDCTEYFDVLDQFLRQTLGDDVAELYDIVVGDPDRVAYLAKVAVDEVYEKRKQSGEAFYFNWSLNIDPELQVPFVPTHDNMAALSLDPSLPKHQLASQLRAVFSGIVAGNVKSFGIKEVAKHGPYRIHGDAEIMAGIDTLLRQFVQAKRMKLVKDENDYQPCYEIIR